MLSGLGWSSLTSVLFFSTIHIDALIPAVLMPRLAKHNQSMYDALAYCRLIAIF